MQTGFLKITRLFPSRVAGILILLLAVFWFQNPVFGVIYKGMANNGTLNFVCETSCGRVRVKKIEKNLYRVLSIGYSGDLVAESEKEAARKACGETAMADSKRVSPSPSRGGSGCP